MLYIISRNPQWNGDNEVHVSPQAYCSSPRYP